MKQSQLFIKTLKESPRDEQSINAQFLIRAGFVRKLMAGVFSFLPLGLKVLQKIENIVREEMTGIFGQEILMPSLQSKELWEKTGRWDKGIGEVMYKAEDEKGKNIGFGPTHEEVVTSLAAEFLKSYEDLPCFIYQIQTKFRKEPRPRSGLLRGREFLMKDLYSFHATENDLNKYYQEAIKAYFRIFKRCGLEPILTEASGGGFSKEYSHEFQVLAKGGEDTIIFCKNKDFAQNIEICKQKSGDKCPNCGAKLLSENSIEVGNIFKLGTKYSESLGCYFATNSGEKKPVIMGCYGFGPSRAMGAVVEVHHDKYGILWPKEIAPLDIHLIELTGKNKNVKKEAEKLYQLLSAPSKSSGRQKNNLEVLYDDRDDKTAGEKFADADLIGIPIRIIISERTLAKNSVEVKKRNESRARLVRIKELPKFFQPK